MREVKIISCSKTRYKSNSLKGAVDARADLLPQEYLNKAKGPIKSPIKSQRALLAQ